jgi:hypothetical protein
VTKQTDDCNSSIEMIDSEDEKIPFKGTVDKRYISDDGRIYVRLSDKEKQYTFEAFPATFDGEGKDGYHFGLYIDSSLCNEGSYNVEVVTQKDNQYYTSGSLMELELEE